MYENLNSKKNTERIKIQVKLIESTLTYSKNKIKNMSKNEKEKLDEIVDIAGKIFDFNKRY